MVQGLDPVDPLHFTTPNWAGPIVILPRQNINISKAKLTGQGEHKPATKMRS